MYATYFDEHKFEKIGVKRTRMKTESNGNSNEGR